MNNMDHSLHLVTQPSSVILSQAMYTCNLMLKCVAKQVEAKRCCNKPTKLQYESILTTESSCVLKQHQSNKVDRKTWLQYV